jgi:hypothetical protein
MSVPSGIAKKAASRSVNIVSIPDGTPIHVRMIDALDTEKSMPGDLFRASLAQPIAVSGRALASKDALVLGKVKDVVSSGRLRPPASITMALTRLTLTDGRTVSVETLPYTLNGKSHALRNTVLIGGGAGAGAVLGGVADGKRGAVIGGAIGAGAGTAAAYLTGKQEIVIPAETSFEFTTVQSAAGSASTLGVSGPLVDSAFPNNRRQSGEWGDLVFSDRDRRTIRDYFRGRYSNLPPGLAKRGGTLPPGLEKHLQRDGKLPPGLQKRVEPFPRDLEARLPRIPERTRRVILGRRALMLDEQNTILDMIDSLTD